MSFKITALPKETIYIGGVGYYFRRLCTLQMERILSNTIRVSDERGGFLGNIWTEEHDYIDERGRPLRRPLDGPGGKPFPVKFRQSFDASRLIGLEHILHSPAKISIQGIKYYSGKEVRVKEYFHKIEVLDLKTSDKIGIVWLEEKPQTVLIDGKKRTYRRPLDWLTFKPLDVKYGEMVNLARLIPELGTKIFPAHGRIQIYGVRYFVYPKDVKKYKLIVCPDAIEIWGRRSKKLKLLLPLSEPITIKIDGRKRAVRFPLDSTGEPLILPEFDREVNLSLLLGSTRKIKGQRAQVFNVRYWFSHEIAREYALVVTFNSIKLMERESRRVKGVIHLSSKEMSIGGREIIPPLDKQGKLVKIDAVSKSVWADEIIEWREAA